jgi:secernin
MTSPGDCPESLVGCDTLVATSSATADGSVIFAKNSDRLPDECQHLRVYPARDWEHGALLRCQYLSIPQAPHTYRVLGSQPFWLWGFEHGVNEHGVAIGNEAIWTKAPRQTTGLLGMDLIRLGLERGRTAHEALDVMTVLVEAHGQGGSPRHNDPAAACYDSSFILADPTEAWVLETSGRDWAARRVEGVYSISNVPSLGTDFELASPALRSRPELHFARDLGDYEKYPQTSGQTRCGRSRQLLQQRAGSIRIADMMALLRDHGPTAGPHNAPPAEPSLCMHPGIGQTAASMVVQLRRDGCTAWCSLVTPCISVFLPFPIDSDIPAVLACGTATYSADSPWWRIKRLLDTAVNDWPAVWPAIRARWDAWQRVLLGEAADYQRASRDERCKWVNNNVTRLLSELGELERACPASRERKRPEGAVTDGLAAVK